MSNIAKISNGTLFKINTSGSTYATVPNTYRIAHPGARIDLVDVTTHDDSSNYREHILGLQDGDNVTCDIHLLLSNSLHQQLRTANEAGTLTNFKIVYPDSSSNTCTFAAYVMNIARRADVGQPMMQAVTLKVEGLHVWS